MTPIQIEELKKKISVEGNLDFFEYLGFPCFIMRGGHLNIFSKLIKYEQNLRFEIGNPNAKSFALCGYVGIPKTHSLYNRQISDKKFPNLDVHGGITFTGFVFQSRDFWLLGFDCAHSGELSSFTRPIEEGRKYIDKTFVMNEVMRLAEQLNRVKRT